MIYIKHFPDVLSVSQTADLLQLSEKTIYRMIKNKEIKSFRLGQRIRIYKKDIVSLVS